MADGVWKGVYPQVFGRSKQLSLNKFFYLSSPSMRKGSKGGRKTTKSRNQGKVVIHFWDQDCEQSLNNAKGKFESTSICTPNGPIPTPTLPSLSGEKKCQSSSALPWSMQLGQKQYVEEVNNVLFEVDGSIGCFFSSNFGHEIWLVGHIQSIRMHSDSIVVPFENIFVSMYW